ncbi:amidase [Coprinopsis marcescibilis]|uniref:amidase n=1 Tax=Coprinopsis marcescibilis TaxID=230819 RepID=A0A5C3KYA3_COPMA|nr:amidase [Coprinopsis marcescibilis]
MWPFTSNESASIIAQKRQQREKLLQEVANASPEEHTSILRARASEIVDKIQAREWSASMVLEAYIIRTTYAHRQTNCLTEVMFESARETARGLDAEFATTGRLKGPLHGVPVSIKEHFNVAGFDTTDGYTAWANQPEKNNADVVDAILAAGGVPFVKTNVPQGVLAFESNNPLWGRTTNPYNPAYSSGGSSGGDSVLLAMDGCPISIGTDAGGSSRIPASYCGIYSLKPGSGRISNVGIKDEMPGCDAIEAISCPMGRSVDDIDVMCRALFGIPGKDNKVAPLAYRDTALPSKLRIGYYLTDNCIKPSPACQRAVLETVKALRDQGHECIEIDLPDISAALSVYIGAVSSDGFETMLKPIGHDPRDDTSRLALLGASLPSFIRNIAVWGVKKFARDNFYANTFHADRKKSVIEYWRIISLKAELQRIFQEQVWDKYGIDTLIGPVQAVPQLPNGGCVKFSALAISTVIYNVADLPAGCIPVTRVDPSVDQITEDWVKSGGHGSSLLEHGIYHASDKIYDPERSKGMPIDVQIIGKKWEEEKLLAVMKLADEALGPRGFGPGSWELHKAEVSEKPADSKV